MGVAELLLSKLPFGAYICIQNPFMNSLTKQSNTQDLALLVVENLKHNFFDACYFSTKTEAEIYINAQIHKDMKVAFGGSVTCKSMNIRAHVTKVGGHIIDHGVPGLTPEQLYSIMRQELTSDLFICSSNAITTSGHLVNVDGNGNRVAAMIFGPAKVIIVAGVNKIVSTEEEAFKRLEHAAAPLNMKRLSRNTPCKEDGRCHNCSSPQRGCRAYTIIRKRPVYTPTEVIIVGEFMGL